MIDTINLTPYAADRLGHIAEMLEEGHIEQLKGFEQDQIVCTAIYYLFFCMSMTGTDLDLQALVSAGELARQVKTEKDAKKLAMDSMKRLMEMMQEMEDDEDE